MGLVLQVSSLVLKISWAFAVFVVLLGSADDADPTSPATFDAISPVGEGTTGPVSQWKQLGKNVPSPSSHSNVVSPPLSSPQAPETTNGQAPLYSPSTPTLLQPSNASAPSTISLGNVPSLPPSASLGQPPSTEDPVLVPEAPVPLVSPSVKSPVESPSVHPVMPGSAPPSSHHSQKPDDTAPLAAPKAPVQSAPPPREMLQTPPTSQPILPKVPDIKAPLSAPIAPIQIAPPPRELLQTPPTSQPILPKVPDIKAPLSAPITPVQIAPPPREMLQTPPTSQPILPKVPDIKAPLSAPIAPVQIAPPPRNTLQTPPTNQPTVPQVQITPPPKEMLQMPPTSQPTLPEVPDNKAPSSVPLVPVHLAPPPRNMVQTPPTSQPTVPAVHSAPPPRGMLQMPPTSQPNMPKVPDNKAPLSSPIAPVQIAQPPREMQIMPPRSQPTVPKIPPSDRPVPATSPPHRLPRYSPPVQPEGPKVPPSISPDSDISSISVAHPSFNSKGRGIPIAAPSQPKQFSPPNLSPAATPKNNSSRDAETAPQPLVVIKSSPHVHPPTPLPAISSYRHHNARMNTTSPGPSYWVPPASADRGRSLSPGSPARASPSRQTRMPFLSPEISPSGSSPMIPKIPHLQPIRAFPPPPPNAECKPLSCVEPLTNTLPGFPCGCILPMQVGLRLGVALYTFFPLVSELATEIAAGVFLKQSQVRIMGANAATEDPDKTIVLMDLVPFGEEFDNNTAYVTYQRFWHKQVPISTSYFGDYEVLYVRYTGLPDSPPSAPSSDTEPHDNQGRTIKPIGVDIRRGQHKKGLKGSIIAVIVLSAVVAMILFCAIAWIMFFRHRDRDFQVQQNPPTKLPSLAKSSGIATSMTGSGPSSLSPSYNSTVAPYTGTAKTFTLSDMERATDNFAASRILGEGGFGLVYGGVLEDGTKVAVKVLKRDDQHGDREFLAEVEMLSRLHHRNLVTLIGICTEERARCLIYELIPNGSVESHLHGVDKEDSPLDWGARVKIALGAARGLAYLHEDSSPRVIHRDFKSSNILLEHDFTPKVSDFGLARSALDEENRHISTRVMGTFGYVAPEYAMTGHLLVKSDVYSYGVVLLELLTGRKPVDMSQPPGQENLVTWSRPLLTSEEGLELIVDKSLEGNISFDSISKVAAIASMCVQPEVSHRPFMGEVVQALKLVLNECDAERDLGSRSCSQEDLSVDFDARPSIHSDHSPDLLQMRSPISDYESAITVERGLPLSEIFSASARIGKTDSESFRRHSSSGPLRSESVLPLWQRMRRLSGGSVSEHGAVFKQWHGYH